MRYALMEHTWRMTPICPKCHVGMKLVRETPGIAALPIIPTYRCGPCGYVFTEAEGVEDEQRALTLDLRAGSEP